MVAPQTLLGQVSLRLRQRHQESRPVPLRQQARAALTRLLPGSWTALFRAGEAVGRSGNHEATGGT